MALKHIGNIAIGIALLAACMIGPVHADERYVSPPFSAGVCAGLKAAYLGRAKAIEVTLRWPDGSTDGGMQCAIDPKAGSLPIVRATVPVDEPADTVCQPGD